MAKNPAAVELGRKGGKARVKNQTPEQRRESARKAAEARWAKLKSLADEITAKTTALEKKSRQYKPARRGAKLSASDIRAFERRGEAYERRSAVRSKKIDKSLKIAKGEQ